MQFNTELTSAVWDDEEGRWTVGTSTGKTFKTRYLITALGSLSRQLFPNYEGINEFRGEMYHTGRWPEGVELKGKRVGIIGNGSTGKNIEQLFWSTNPFQYTHMSNAYQEYKSSQPLPPPSQNSPPSNETPNTAFPAAKDPSHPPTASR